jgi:predicted porin
MNKFVKVASGLVLALAMVSAASAQDVSFAQTSVSGTVDGVSRFDYRGQEYSNDPSLGLGLKVSNIGSTGLYVAGQFDKTGNTTPFNAHQQVRSDVGVGYEFTPVDKLNLDVSLNHVYNAPEYQTVRYGQLTDGQYSEFRLKASYDIFFAQLGQGWGPYKSTYLTAGVEVPVPQIDALHVGAAVSGYHYNDAGNQSASSDRYNNSEIFARYDFSKHLNVYGKYSFGGKNEYNYTLSNYGVVGVAYNF